MIEGEEDRGVGMKGGREKERRTRQRERKRGD